MYLVINIKSDHQIVVGHRDSPTKISSVLKIIWPKSVSRKKTCITSLTTLNPLEDLQVQLKQANLIYLLSCA